MQGVHARDKPGVGLVGQQKRDHRGVADWMAISKGVLNAFGLPRRVCGALTSAPPTTSASATASFLFRLMMASAIGTMKPRTGTSAALWSGGLPVMSEALGETLFQ